MKGFMSDLTGSGFLGYGTDGSGASVFGNGNTETLTFTIRIQDKDKNWSNKITTGLITVNKQ